MWGLDVMLKPGFDKQVNLEECKLEEFKLTEETADKATSSIRAKVRFDYRGKAIPSRFFFGGKSTGEAAVELRQQQAALWKNIPVQGVRVENIDLGEMYTVHDEDADGEVTFAPLELDIIAESPADLVRFAVRDEFRRIQIVEPQERVISDREMERIFFQIHEQAKTQVYLKARRYQD